MKRFRQQSSLLGAALVKECRREVEEEQDEVRLVCREGLEVYTHRAILGLLSPMLRSILASCPTSYLTFLLPDYSKEQVQLLLKVLRGEWGEGSRVSLGVVELLQDLGIDLQGEQEVEGRASLKEQTFLDDQETVIHATTINEKSKFRGYSTLIEALLHPDEIVEEANVKPLKVASHAKVKKALYEAKRFKAMKSDQENQGNVKSCKQKIDQYLFPVKKVRIVLENVNKIFPVEFNFSKDNSPKKQDEDLSNNEYDPPAMSIEEIQKMLLPYQDDFEKAVSKESVYVRTPNDEMVEEDDEIIEVAVPPKPEAPLIDLELEEDVDPKLISIVDKCRQLL